MGRRWEREGRVRPDQRGAPPPHTQSWRGWWARGEISHVLAHRPFLLRSLAGRVGRFREGSGRRECVRVEERRNASKTEDRGVTARLSGGWEAPTRGVPVRCAGAGSERWGVTEACVPLQVTENPAQARRSACPSPKEPGGGRRGWGSCFHWACQGAGCSLSESSLEFGFYLCGCKITITQWPHPDERRWCRGHSLIPCPSLRKGCPPQIFLSLAELWHVTRWLPRS